MIKVVIFDADGVLINGIRFSTALERDYGISIETTLPFFNGPFQDCLVNSSDLKDTISPYLSEWGWHDGVDSFLDYWFKVEHTINEELISYIQDMRSKGFVCCVATNNEKYRFQYMLDEMGFKNSFDRIYASANLGHVKPNLEFYKKLLDDLGSVNKDEVLFWDDSPENITSAREFGINAELFSSFSDFKRRMKIYPQFSSK